MYRSVAVFSGDLGYFFKDFGILDVPPGIRTRLAVYPADFGNAEGVLF
jgi:hypothetical protein